MNYSKAVLSSFLLMILGLTAPSLSSAAPFKFKTGIRVREVYTDNVDLSASDKESKIISTVTPILNFSTEESSKGRINADLITGVEFNDLGGNSDKVNVRLQGNSDIELWKNHFFIDADASARQVAINPFLPSASDNLNQTNNSVTLYDYGLAPRFSSKFGDFAGMEIRFRYDEQKSSGENSDSVSDSNGQEGTIVFSSGPEFKRVYWALSGSYEKSDYSKTQSFNAPDNERNTADFTANYRLSRKYSLTGTVGKEWNNFFSLNPNIDDEFWSAGFIWTPNRRMTLKIGSGERYFGKTPYLKLSYKSRRSQLVLDYSRTLTDTRNLLLSQRRFPNITHAIVDLSTGTIRDTNGNIISVFDPSVGHFVLVDDFGSTVDNGIFVDQRAAMTFTVTGIRSSISFGAWQSKRIRQDAINESEFNSVFIALNRRLSKSITADTRFGWDERIDQQYSDSKIWRASLGLTFDAGVNSNIGLDYQFSHRDSGDSLTDYDENRLSLSFSYHF